MRHFLGEAQVLAHRTRWTPAGVIVSSVAAIRLAYHDAAHGKKLRAVGLADGVAERVTKRTQRNHCLRTRVIGDDATQGYTSLFYGQRPLPHYKKGSRGLVYSPSRCGLEPHIYAFP